MTGGDGPQAGSVCGHRGHVDAQVVRLVPVELRHPSGEQDLHAPGATRYGPMMEPRGYLN